MSEWTMLIESTARARVPALAASIMAHNPLMVRLYQAGLHRRCFIWSEDDFVRPEFEDYDDYPV